MGNSILELSRLLETFLVGLYYVFIFGVLKVFPDPQSVKNDSRVSLFLNDFIAPSTAVTKQNVGRVQTREVTQLINAHTNTKFHRIFASRMPLCLFSVSTPDINSSIHGSIPTRRFLWPFNNLLSDLQRTWFSLKTTWMSLKQTLKH